MRSILNLQERLFTGEFNFVDITVFQHSRNKSIHIPRAQENNERTIYERCDRFSIRNTHESKDKLFIDGTYLRIL